MSDEETVQDVPCACHPECEHGCRIEQHPVDNPCVCPDCLTWTEMRNRLIDLRAEGLA